MLGLSLAFVLLAQGPVATLASSGGAEARYDGLVVEGPIELSRAEAEASALRLARERLVERRRELGVEIAERRGPWWLPPFFVDRLVDDWAADAATGRALEVRHSDTQAHDYTYGQAFLTTLVVEDPGASRAHQAGLERGLDRAGKLFLTRCGALAGLWGLLAFFASWLDRLSRGYMTWRLRFLAGALGVVAAPLALLL
ncbi:MAG: hypothetical protein AAF628_00390 [Planctomycetota bacterium]